MFSLGSLGVIRRLKCARQKNIEVLFALGRSNEAKVSSKIYELRNMNDDNKRLDEKICRWTVNSDLPADFQSQVWKRIAHDDRRSVVLSFDAFFMWFTECLQHRTAATAFLLVAALFGGGLGGIHAMIDSNESHVKMAESYLQSVDPSRHSLE